MMDYVRKISVQVSTIISPILGKIHSPWSRKKVTSFDYHAVINLALPPGSVIATRTMGEITNLFIPEYFKHVAITTDRGTVIEATTKGVIETDLIDFLLRKDYFAVYLPLFADLDQMIAACEFAKAQVGKSYDYAFATSDIKSFYCAEIIYASYQVAVGDSPFTLRPRLGQLTVLPNDIANATSKWREVYRSRSMKA